MEQTKLQIKSKYFTITFIVLVLIIGIVARFYAMTKGHNFDFESYKIIADIVGGGGNVYAETTRYNYGPVWFSLLGLFHWIGSFFANPEIVFRVLIVSLLTAVDVAIALLLRRKYGLVAFAAFILNPISVIITGYHNQFDNIAILIGLIGLMLAPKAGAKTISRRHVISALIIGFSLMTKHILFIIPIWLFIKEKSWKVKLFMLFTPLVVFIMGFLPFATVGGEGILQNVFLYKSFSNAPLANALLSHDVVNTISPMAVLIVALLVVGFMTRKLNNLEAGLWYLLTLVAFSPAIANQYLAIVVSAVASLGFIFFIPFILTATILLAITSNDGIQAVRYAEYVPEKLLPYVDSGQYKLIIGMLFLGMILAAIYKYRRGWYGKVYVAIRHNINKQLQPFLKLITKRDK